MSLDPNTLDLSQCIRGCSIRFGFNEDPVLTWEAAASVPSQELRDLLFPYGEPLSYPDGPPSVICGMTPEEFVSECLTRANLPEVNDEEPVTALRRCLSS